MRNTCLVPNPPWVGEAIAETYEFLEAHVKAAWLPVLASVKTGRGGSVVGEVEELGCGSYGCVVPTLDPTIVLKITDDDTEAEFAAELAGDLVAPICVRYPMVIRTHLKSPHNRGLYFLWRDAADGVGKIRERLGGLAAQYIRKQHSAGEAAYRAIQHGEPGAWPLLMAWLESCEVMARQTDVPELRPLGDGLVEVWGQQNILFGDIHVGNLGLVNGRWVITDPGHIVVIDRDSLPDRTDRDAPHENPGDDRIADIVNDAARKVAIGPGREHAYLADVWEQIKRDGRDSGYSYDQFKCEVIRLYNDNLLGLDRAMDARSKAAKASELKIEGDTFHLVVVEPDTEPAPPMRSHLPMTDPEFAERVNAIASEVGPEGRFGDRKVFISEVWAVASQDPRFARMGQELFKQRLVDARRSISLARADLVSAMDPDHVADSETSVDRVTYHFVVDPRFGARPAAQIPPKSSSGRQPDLLAAVREALPRVGPEGRFGPRKVFVSALWRKVELDPRARGMSLDGFKRWLVSANSERQLDLARADLVGAMDRRLVAESEIEDLGSTFHFVLDPNARDY